MRKIIVATALAAFTLTTVAAGPQASSAPDGYQGEMTLAAGESATFEGPAGTGGFGGDADSCTSGDYTNPCDKVLVELKADGTFDFLFDAAYDPADYDISVRLSDADGTLGEEVASSGAFWGPVDDSTVLTLSPYESGSFEAKKGYYAVVVVYFAAGGGYTLDVSLA